MNIFLSKKIFPPHFKWSWTIWFCLVSVKSRVIVSSFSRALCPVINTGGGKLRKEYYKWTEAYSFSPSDFTELLCQLGVQTASTYLPELPRALPMHWKHFHPGQRNLMQASWGCESKVSRLFLTAALLLTQGTAIAGAGRLGLGPLCQLLNFLQAQC